MKRSERVFLAAALAAALLLGAGSVREWNRARGAGEAARAAGVTAGQARDLDAAKIARQIRQRRLAAHEAKFYKQASPPLPVAAPVPSGSPTP